ncbi:histidine--tRNA ligase [Nitrobacter winogradskyi]|uniref:Histidyl-tRNA synthetase n=2 Tax=Nitrobacter winogradskyi TaxID=913 RepID=A0ACC6AHW0_NITWI|nr:histidine--tRNA ligase [Nitrobacter winogradskyi]MCP1999261.1 histidyl-tRNA synthetase [Nitrobacter winogradskyi]GEC14554.1 histidine--tRNA ligase [Nitrobacter winogradskyi]
MSDKKPKKPQKLRARLPRGLEDRGPAAIAATRRMVEKIRAVYERYGFEPVETPAFEYTDALGKFLPDQDRPNEGVFSFQDDDEQWISLRYDLTAPLARYVAENFQNLALPYRSYRAGYVYRNEKPGPGRFRQFMQFDADTVGSASPAADAEMCMMAADTMEALGIPASQFVVKVNNRKLLDGILDSIGLGGADHAARKLTILRAMDKFDKFGVEGVRLLLGQGRKDESGDFTKGAGLSERDIETVISVFGVGAVLTDCATTDEKQARPRDVLTFSSSDGEKWHRKVTFNSVFETLKFVREKLGDSAKVFDDGISELRQISELLSASGYGDGRVRIDPSVVRGLEYYTGPVFEVELLLETKDEKGRPVRFGSVGGGGRYDGLVSRFRGEPVPATGFSIGVSRLQAALTMLDKLDTKPQPGPVVVTVFGGDIASYQKMVADLRNAGIRAELYLGNPKHSLGQQMRYADKRNSPCAIIQGTDEKANGKVLIKDLIAGAGLTSIEDRAEYLKKQAEAQIEAGESDLVTEVRKLLARHDVRWD